MAEADEAWPQRDGVETRAAGRSAMPPRCATAQRERGV